MLEEQKYKAKNDILNALNEYFPIGQNDERAVRIYYKKKIIAHKFLNNGM
jgi:hypothetical protein